MMLAEQKISDINKRNRSNSNGMFVVLSQQREREQDGFGGAA